MATKLLKKFDKSIGTASVRCLHQVNIAQGGGGRSSYSGVSATVFGATGHIGRTVTNHLASTGTQLIIPFRGEDKRVLPLKVMSDLGQMMFRPHRINEDEENTRELIQYSNVVLNFVGSDRPFNFYSLEDVNLEWPKNLARMVAEKNDGTKLIHMTNLACHQEKARNISKVLALQYEAECAMKEIYPDTTIVRSAQVYGAKDKYVNLLTNPRWADMAILGALPCLHGGGKNTTVQPVFISDLAKAISTIAKEEACRGQTFEFVGRDRFKLSDMIDYLYELPIHGKEHKHLGDAIGPIDRTEPAKISQQLTRIALDMYFRRQYRPSLLPRFADLVWKHFDRTTWMSEEKFKMIHFNDFLSGEKPGFDDLLIEPTGFEQKIYELFYSATADPSHYIEFNENKTIPRVSTNDIYGGDLRAENLVAGL